jgi:O-antigen/teichoic acid export membrane protein
MTERIGIWIEATSPRILHPIWLRFRASPLSVRLAHGVFWSLIGAVLARGLSVVSSIIVARMLGITAFGEFMMIQNTVGLFGIFAGLGLGITATKYIAEMRETDPARCGRIIGLILIVATAGGLAAGAALLLFAPWIASNTLAAPQLAPLLRAGATLVLFNTLQGVYTGALGGFEAFKRVARVNWLGAVIGTPLLVLCTFLDGIRGAVWGSVLQILIGCVIGHFTLLQEAARKNVTLSYAVTRSDYHIFWRFSLPVFLSEIIFSPANWITTTYLVRQKAGFNELAILNAAGQWRNIISYLPQTMTTVLVPIFASLYRENNQPEFLKILRRNLCLNFGTCLALGLPLAALAPFVLNWYGQGFGSGVPAFLLILATTVIASATNLFARALQATGRPWIELSFTALWGATLILATFIFVPGLKGVGLAMAHVIATAVMAIWQWLLVRRIFVKKAAISNRPFAPEIVASN